VINTNPPRTRSKSAQRHGFICKWDAESWAIEKRRKASDRPVTCFDVSGDGKLLAFGSSDLTIGLLNATTLAPLVTILKAHELPLTTIKFNPTSTLLVSGSADNSIRVVAVPQQFGGSTWWTTVLLWLTLLVILAVIVEKYLHPGALSP